MTVVLWSVDPLDWKLQNTNKVVRKIVKNVEPGDIILMHDVFPDFGAGGAGGRRYFGEAGAYFCHSGGASGGLISCVP